MQAREGEQIDAAMITQPSYEWILFGHGGDPINIWKFIAVSSRSPYRLLKRSTLSKTS
ncbi:protein of unknown function (plasmid) [Cupriavidus taiwanensis]|uniref:Uncharacterized protein n=1 Tax=Cupriavidus taiwanensis TaxID=164546 RepID=A0A375EEL7_9BURK|nr:protein of unknown function [Cupriavidus taiwanensis]SOZ72221.1 protein of unknown function [Cupriavidus taiwanensis]SOZ74526.1 protein of unknown function [Cupriavidus taiwanensis]SPA03448.1 protein of unknown function [Cupriavidus taiwanensis]SPA11322.1 protein of unknown function [Cupriavidus taiwanensis]